MDTAENLGSLTSIETWTVFPCSKWKYEVFICRSECCYVMKGKCALLSKPAAPGCLALDVKLGAISSDQGLLQWETAQLSGCTVILI